MKVFLLRDGKRIPCKVPHEGARYVSVPGYGCPECGEEDFLVTGTQRRIASDDKAYEADAWCAKCEKYVGVLRAEMSTIFGVHEDEAVMRRCRVY